MGNVVGQDTTYTGNPASFTGVAESVISSVLVPIAPVQSGSGTPSPSNPRPISGLTSATVYRTGKNIWYEDIADWKLGWVIPAGGVEEENSAYKYCQTYFPVEPSTKYAVQAVKTSSVSAAFTIIYYDENKSFMSRSVIFASGASSGLNTGTFTTPSTCSYIRLNAPKTAASNIQIEKGNVCTDYEDSGQTYSVDWTSVAGTVYGGTVDISTGLLTVTKAVIDMGSMSWTKYDSDIAPTGYAFYANMTGGIRADTARLCSDYWYSDVVGFAETYATYGINDMLCWSNSSTQRVYLANSNYSDTTTLKNSLDGVQLVYTLGTPVAYQLTPKEVTALVGTNNVWTSTDATVTVTVRSPLSGFQGWLVKAITNGTPVEIPLKYIRAETYTVTPDQRMEWSAERDVTGVLHRETVQNLPPKIEFNTPLLTNVDINALNTIIKNAFTSYLQRNITIQFYDPERDQYWEWDCYMPDVHYSIRMVDATNNVVHYEETRYAFIGR